MKTVLLTASVLALSSLALAFRPAAAPRATPTSADATTYEVDGGHSSVVYKVLHMGVSNFYGAFGSVGGEIVYDPKNLSASSIKVEIDAASVDSRNEKRDAHLKSPDFLNASEFPKIVFQSSKVEGKGDEFTVKGELELRGSKRPVTAKVKKIGEAAGERGKLIGFEAHFTIDAGEFDLHYVAQQMPLGHEIEVIVSLECQARG